MLRILVIQGFRLVFNRELFIYFLCIFRKILGLMKKALLILLFLSSLTSYSQTMVALTPPKNEVDLKLNHVFSEKGPDNPNKKALNHVLIGAALTTLGVGVGLVGPMFINAPEDPTAKYLREVQLTGNNANAAQARNRIYQNDMAAYNDKLDQNKSTANTLRLIGLGVFGIGASFNVSGIAKLVK